MLEKFIARQPIFDDKLKLFAYELLFRSSSENVFRPYKAASDSLIVDSTSLFGLQALTGHAKAFVNLDLLALQRGTARLLPPDQVVIEILENIAPTQEVIQLCAELSNEGYALALDDYVGHPKWEPLLPLVKFLKVDFRACDPPARAAIANRHRVKPGAEAAGNSIRLLAEKIETNDDLLEARSLGYAYFQGYFFCKPSTLSVREIPGNKLNCLRLLHLVASPDFSYDAVEELLKTDPALVYKLLRYLNSWLVAIRGEIHSIREAIALLGEKEFRRWISVLAVVAMASDKPHELIRTALTRAFFCESLARAIAAPAPISTNPTPPAPLASTSTSTSTPNSSQPIVLAPMQSSDLFLMGLLSVTDAILDRPMQQVLASLPIAPAVRAALCGESNSHREVYDLLLAWERADWTAMSAASTRLGVTESAVADCEQKAREAASIC